ncbi:glycosyltransferase involved in cell wall biosynthesis [Saccharopolyspora phatthalungensis]|uniref:Glycosyltransferase involved in cell wall biosynthesis n=2 Tax=Saccharopolyspora phatthalungensis TaxID=664693 RepID=A0A840QEW8_9PSEU|nr:glycosyltransferase involved in cell wall biosynthesis [Saccharopolyspora phatthalungensis]
MIGTRGVPARYGGFETCVEEVGRRLVERGHEVTVYCRGAGVRSARAESHCGMRLVHLPALRRKTLETLSHTALSALHAVVRRPDVAVVFNAANAPLLPLLRLRGTPTITHVDGLEWKRAKWGPAGSAYYRRAEALAVRWSDALIADAWGIQDYYRDRFGTETEYIPYGAPILSEVGTDGITELGLRPRHYHLVVARFEPENHVHVAVDGYLRSNARHPLVVVGSAPYADEYTASIKRAAKRNPNVRLLGGVWDQKLLDQLYGNALTYIHGHSVGGTNPSLLRAMGAGAPTSAFDVRFNREVLGSFGRYFRDAADLAALCDAAEADPASTSLRGQEQVQSLDRYTWDGVAEKYEELAARVLLGGKRKSAPPGRAKAAVTTAVSRQETKEVR